MSKLSKRLPDDNKKLQALVGEISWSENPAVGIILVELEDLNAEAASLAASIKTNLSVGGHKL